MNKRHGMCECGRGWKLGADRGCEACDEIEILRCRREVRAPRLVCDFADVKRALAAAVGRMTREGRL